MSKDKEMPETMDLSSMDLPEANRAKLKALFPSVFTETINEDGQLVESIDFEKLKAELGTFSDVFEKRREHYGMDWPGKKECLQLIQQPSVGTLKPCREESVNFDETENLFIEGDNLEVLKLLQKSYYGKVKMIYIDPPYNTGKEFIYPDKYSESLDTYLAYAGLVDDEGKKFSTNTPNEGRFHTKWLNMMYPRLYLARNLLRNDGALLVSIDDNELLNLISIGNDVFGEHNFVATIAWQKVFAKKNKAIISGSHDHILIFAKNIEKWDRNLLPRSDEQLKAFSNPDNDPRGDWQSVSFSVQSEDSEKRSAYRYNVQLPSGREVMPPPGRHWNGLVEKYKILLGDNRIWFGQDGDSLPREKVFLSEVQQGIVPDTWWPHTETGNNQEAKKEIIELFGADEPYSTPKPTRLILRMLQIGTNPNNSDIILDFFAGSGSTAHAVMKANIADNGNRKFILVQLPERTKYDKYSNYI